MSTSRAAKGAAAYAAMRAAAAVADHWVQTGHQAAHKADAGLAGHRAMAGHVASYAASQAAALVAADRLLGIGLKPSRIAAAVAFSAATHWFIDRRWPVKRLAQATGKEAFHDLGGPLGGAYILDQSAHHLMEAVAAVVAARD
ncbi:hypothetical protein [Streptomyces phage phiSAJS1]|uniref:membrane protein n=1 Tax=Streptomyces phage phiSAJS1 TaxID=1755682 RepID=UPI0007215AF2|nr:membrane protein [Streptomyces phage phiSAJS1]ALO79359.1 hypothetical protein [Streptomyces phage phiSAJS1]